MSYEEECEAFALDPMAAWREHCDHEFNSQYDRYDGLRMDFANDFCDFEDYDESWSNLPEDFDVNLLIVEEYENQLQLAEHADDQRIEYFYPIPF